MNLAKIVRDGGDIWAGAYLGLDGPLDFSNDNYITFRLWTDAPVNTIVKLKLEQNINRGNSAELDVLTTKTGEWETLSWNFSSWGSTVFDRVVFMFDFGNTGNGSSTSTFYFDDVHQVATLGLPFPSEECVTNCPTDIDENGVTNGDDFSIFLGNFGLNCSLPPCATDYDSDGDTDGDDFSVFLGNFGLVCN